MKYHSWRPPPLKRLSHGQRWLLCYALLLIASHGFRCFLSPLGPSLPGQQWVEVPVALGDRRGSSSVSLAYRDIFPPEGEGAPALVLVHGTPMASASMDALIPFLSDNYRLIVPDLPGFGGSTRVLPDYSVRAHAYYLIDLLKTLNLSRAHFLGYSQGGGVLLNLAEIAPERVASLIMVSAIGVEELELFGSHYLNRTVYALQWAGIRFLQEGVPHFGLLDNILLDNAYARNFYDSDLRPLREILKRYHAPMLIIHGRQDQLAAFDAGREHYRLVPQSQWVPLEGNHFLIFSHPEQLAEPIREFIEASEREEAKTRASADHQRIWAASQPFDYATANLSVPAMTLLVALAVLVLAAFFFEDVACLGAGLLIAYPYSIISFFSALSACLGGALGRHLWLYRVGRRKRESLLYKKTFGWFISPSMIALSELWIARIGATFFLQARFIPGSRSAASLAAGLLKFGFGKFFLTMSLALALEKLILMALAVFLGKVLFDHFSLPSKSIVGVLLGAGLSLTLLVKIGRPLSSYRGRRFLLSLWRRQTRWEFWPLWKFYPPVVLYVLYLGLKYRSPTLFTAVNPAMPASGFIGEEKSSILHSLASSGAPVAPWLLLKKTLEPESRLERVVAFMRQQALTFPIVFKPEEGQRGLGVAIISSPEQAADYLAQAKTDILVQERIPGIEFGIFYYRYPGEESGHIFSITTKEFPAIRGNGQKTVEELILDHERAVCMAPFFLYQHRHRLFQVPAAGEEIPLVELGTHSRGSIFRNGEDLKSPALIAAFDRMSKPYEGFFFGRYDVRVPSKEALRAGRDITVIELNGITSEATHIYDPKNSLFYAYKTLMKQWRIAFEIGARNRRRGIEPLSPTALLKHFCRAAARQRGISIKPRNRCPNATRIMF